MFTGAGFFAPRTTSFPFPLSTFTGAGDSSASSASSSRFKTANRFMYRGEGDREGGATTRGLALVPGCNCEVGLGRAGGKPTGPRETGMGEIAGVGFAVWEGLVNCAGEIGMGAGPAGGERRKIITFNLLTMPASINKI